MKTPHRGASSDRPQSYKDRELAGLNPHIQARNGHKAVPTDETLEANPESIMRVKDILGLLKKAEQEHPDQTYIRHVRMYHYEGYTLAEVALDMDASKSTAQSRMNRTCAFLKEYIRGHEQ